MSGIISQNSSRHTGLLKASSGGSAVYNLIETQTASSSSTISFTSGIDSTYDEYVFKFYDIHPSHASTRFQFNGSTDSGSNYNVTKTTAMFIAANNESGADNALSYQSDDDLAQSTGFQDLAAYGDANDDADSCLAGTLHFFNPASTTFVKHFIARTIYMTTGPYPVDSYTAGYFNTTSAIDAIQFKFTSNNIDSGQISLYGIS